MEYKRREAEYLLELIAFAVNGGELSSPDGGFDWDNLYELAVLHKVEALIYFALTRVEPRVDDGIVEKYERSYKKAIGAEYIQHSEGVKIFKALEQAGISFLPLKGWIIKELYPQSVMRSMCDIDVLVHTEHSQAVREVMEGMGYTTVDFGANPDTYIKKPLMNIEVHKALIRDRTDHFKTTWDRAVLKPGSSYRYEMTAEDYYIFMMAHLKKHFVGTGTGVRSVVDVWVYLKKYEDALDWGYIRDKLTKSGIWDFDRKIYDICRCWFCGERSEREDDAMVRELLFSAVYGTQQTIKENTVAGQISTIKGGSATSKKLRYLLRLLFPGIEVMSKRYPWVAMSPMLLPFAWIARGFVCLLFRNGHMREVIGDVTGTQNRKIEK